MDYTEDKKHDSDLLHLEQTFKVCNKKFILCGEGIKMCVFFWGLCHIHFLCRSVAFSSSITPVSTFQSMLPATLIYNEFL